MDAKTDTTHPRAEVACASELLEELKDAFPDERITVGELLDRLEGRAFGLLILLLAVPNCIPNIPGISTIFGVLLAAPAFQLIVGSKKLWLPARIRRWSFQREHLRMAIRGAVPALRRIERLVQPRWTWALRPPFTIYLGFQTLFLALVLIMPIFLGNFGPGLTVAATALALLQRDGRLALLTIPMTFFATALAWAGILISLAAFREAVEIVFSLFGL